MVSEKKRSEREGKQREVGREREIMSEKMSEWGSIEGRKITSKSGKDWGR